MNSISNFSSYHKNKRKKPGVFSVVSLNCVIYFLLFVSVFPSILISSANSQEETPQPQTQNDSDSQISKSGNGEFTRSIHLLQNLAEKDEIIYNFMGDFLEELKNESSENEEKGKEIPELIHLVKRYLKDFETTTGKITNDRKHDETESKGNVNFSKFRAEQISWNPLASFRLIRRISVDLKIILSRLLNFTEFVSKVRNLMADFGWPSEESDLKSSMEAIWRIQLVYNLNSQHLADGFIRGRDKKIGLTAHDCFRMADLVFENECCYETAESWLQTAQKKLDNLNETTEISEENLKNLNETIKSHLLKAQQLIQIEKELEKNQSERNEQTEESEKVPTTRETFYSLCNGNILQKPEEQKNLFCWHESNRGLQISPMKAELLSANPLIIQFYDLLSDSTIDKIKRQASPNLSRSRVFDGDDSEIKGQVASYRTSLSTWIDDRKIPQFGKIPKIIEKVTGLTVKKPGAAEFLQIASYSFGGHYQLHFDEVENPVESVGDGRIATFMFYLTDVEEGGFTAFPFARVAARPKKASAVFWFNLLNDGQLDKRTEHGACPSIFGEKWVANKWILYNSQWTNHKCGMKPQSQMQMKAAGKIIQ